MTENKWIIKEEKFLADDIYQNGSRFLIGNGYMGYRGTLEEFCKDELVALNMAGLFDQNGDKWRESVNAANPFYVITVADGEILNVKNGNVISHEQCLNIRQGIHTRKTVFSCTKGKITVFCERFLSLDNENICGMRYTVSADHDAEIKIHTCMDTDVWNINGEHFSVIGKESANGNNIVKLQTGELCIPIVMYENINGVAVGQKIHVKAGSELVMEKICGVYWGETVKNAEEKFGAAVNDGYDCLLDAHKKQWDLFWLRSDIEIEGDREAQFAIRYSIYHLNCIAPRNSAKCGIPARGLSGQVYKGAAFWDTEMFMMPFFSFTNPEFCRNMVKYRINTLSAAKDKALEWGYEGAFYPWESQETGEDACTLFNVTDIFTNRPMRTHFKDRQIHVSADMVYGLWEYCKVSGDYSLIKDGGLEMMYQCVLFYYSYAVYKPLRDRFELHCVVGPDEYHECVDNNAFTNKMVKYTIDAFKDALSYLKKENEELYSEFISSHDIGFVDDFSKKLYCPAPNKENIISQFDGYFKLEDISLEELKKRIIIPNEYLGGGNGLATTTQIIKQADVLMMLNVFRNEYSNAVKKANWEYYEPRTEHGSSLSACAYGIVASNIGLTDIGYKFFIKTATVDLTGDTKQYLGDMYIGGTHPAANGGSWSSVVFGFAGISYRNGVLDISPNLPRHWTKLKFNLMWQGRKLQIEITHDEIKVYCEDNAEKVHVTVFGKEYEIKSELK